MKRRVAVLVLSPCRVLLAHGRVILVEVLESRLEIVSATRQLHLPSRVQVDAAVAYTPAHSGARACHSCGEGPVHCS